MKFIDEIAQAKFEAENIALRASDWLNGKEDKSIFANPTVVLACVQGAAEKLVFMLDEIEKEARVPTGGKGR
jgi:hypothetical protein